MKRYKLRQRLNEYLGKGYWESLNSEHKQEWLKVGAYGTWVAKKNGKLEELTRNIEKKLNV